MNAEIWTWIVIGVGCAPWLVMRRTVVVKDGRRRRAAVRWQVRALFWEFTCTHPGRGWAKAEWRLRIPLVERLQKAVWAAVQSLFR